MAVPLLVAVTVGLVWLLAVGVAQVRVVDAARETARLAARGEAPAEALEAGRRVAPAGARVGLDASGERVRATVSVRVAGPGGVLSILPAVEVDAEAVATSEQRERS